jgi:carboxyl-terminal processing protease
VLKLDIMKKIFYIIIFIFIVFGAFWGGFFTAKHYGVLPDNLLNFQSNFFSGQNLTLFWEAWQAVSNKFIDREKIDQKKAFYGALQGMVKSIGDDYTEFYSPQEAKIFNEDISGSFEGVGMEITVRRGIITVVSPLEDTPAWRAGIKSGDLILKINNEDATNLKLEEAVMKIRGPKGTKVILTIMREDFKEPKDIEIVRDVIVVHAVKFKMLENNIGYIKILNFGKNSVPEFYNAINDLLTKGANKLILDLRNNPGGFLESAVIISSWFLPKGDKVVIEDFGGKSPQRIHRSLGPGILSNLPLVVLVNRGSASASEILAGALRDNLNVKILGEKTFGKGSVQEVVNLSDGSLVKVTVARWLTPKGKLIEGKGIDPDIEIKNESDKEDLVLNKAIEILKNK